MTTPRLLAGPGSRPWQDSRTGINPFRARPGPVDFGNPATWLGSQVRWLCDSASRRMCLFGPYSIVRRVAPLERRVIDPFVSDATNVVPSDTAALRRWLWSGVVWFSGPYGNCLVLLADPTSAVHPESSQFAAW